MFRTFRLPLFAVVVALAGLALLWGSPPGVRADTITVTSNVATVGCNGTATIFVNGATPNASLTITSNLPGSMLLLQGQTSGTTTIQGTVPASGQASVIFQAPAASGGSATITAQSTGGGVNSTVVTV